MNKRSIFSRALIAAFALATLSLGPATGQGLTTVHVGVLGNDDMTSVLYAVKTGMFQRAGLDVQLDRSSTSGAAIAAAVSAGTYEIGKSSLSGIIDAHLHDIPFTLIGTAAVYESKAPYVGFIVPKDSPIKTARDFKDGIVGLSFVRDGGQLALTKILDEAGLSIKGLQFTEIPMSAAPPAVEQGRVIAAEISFPPAQAAIDSGKFRLIPAYDTFGSSYTFSVWFTTKDFVAKHGDVVKTFARVTSESARYTNAHHDVTAPMLAEFTGIPLATIQRMPRVTNGTGISVAGVQPYIDAAAKYGFIARTFPAKEMIESSVEAR